ncbi:MAG TPA: hypothetical protein VFI14_08250, partial [Chryseosolibacter sp.]|nr:hypothetical protein [Chryseosolibacter sp.]
FRQYRRVTKEFGFVQVWKIKNVRLAECCQTIIQMNDTTLLEFVLVFLGMGCRQVEKPKRDYYDKNIRFQLAFFVKWG